MEETYEVIDSIPFQSGQDCPYNTLPTIPGKPALKISDGVSTTCFKRTISSLLANVSPIFILDYPVINFSQSQISIWRQIIFICPPFTIVSEYLAIFTIFHFIPPWEAQLLSTLYR